MLNQQDFHFVLLFSQKLWELIKLSCTVLKWTEHLLMYWPQLFFVYIPICESENRDEFVL